MFWDEDSLDGTLSVKVHDWAEKNIFLLNINSFIKLSNINRYSHFNYKNIGVGAETYFGKC